MKVEGKWIKGSVCSTGYISHPYKASVEYEKPYQKYFKTKEETIAYLKQMYEEHGCPPPRKYKGNTENWRFSGGRVSEFQQANIPFGQGQSQIGALLRALRPRGK